MLLLTAIRCIITEMTMIMPNDIARFVMATYCKNIEHCPTPRREYMPGVFSVTNNVMHGTCGRQHLTAGVHSEPVSDRMGPTIRRQAP